MTTTKDVYEMDETEFTAFLASETTPLNIWTNAPDIYEELKSVTGQDCYDSVLREWAFSWASKRLGRPYDDIYNRWLGI